MTETPTPRRPEQPVVGPPPPFDAECMATLSAMPDQMSTSLTPEMIPQARALSQMAPSDNVLRRGGAFEVEHRTVPGPAGAPEIQLLICRPTAARAPQPALYYAHGGGMVAGTRRTGLPEILQMAEGLGVAVVSVEYRLAPENPDPAPIEDCYAGALWVSRNAAELGIDPERLVVAGASAGGGLAAGLALLARDRGGPALAGQLLIYPMLDDRNDTASSLQMAGLGVWDHDTNETGWNALLGDRRGGPDVSPYAAPSRAASLAELPPALVDVGSAETFRDEVVDYASRLWQAGGDAELHVWPGGFHGYDQAAPKSRLAQESWEARRRWLASLLDR